MQFNHHHHHHHHLNINPLKANTKIRANTIYENHSSMNHLKHKMSAYINLIIIESTYLIFYPGF